MHLRWKLREQPRQVRLHASRVQLVQIIEHQDEAARIVGEVRQHSVDHRLCVESGRRDQRLIRVAFIDRLTDSTEQGEPEQLLVTLIAAHGDERHSVCLPRPIRPGP